MDYKGAPRYSLVLVTTSGIKYYYDVNLGNFVMLQQGIEPKKSSLQEIDAVTTNFLDKEQLAKTYSIEEPISRIHISYEFNGEKRIAPVFNNREWAHVATTCRKSGVNFSDRENFTILADIYQEILDLNSSFSDLLLKDEKKLINLSPKTRDAIRNIRTHERETNSKRTHGYPMNSLETEIRVNEIYDKDKAGFFNVFKGRLTRYREFRSIYFNYCKFKNIERSSEISKDLIPKKKAFVPPYQISMFENN